MRAAARQSNGERKKRRLLEGQSYSWPEVVARTNASNCGNKALAMAWKDFFFFFYYFKAEGPDVYSGAWPYPYIIIEEPPNDREKISRRTIGKNAGTAGGNGGGGFDRRPVWMLDRSEAMAGGGERLREARRKLLRGVAGCRASPCSL